MKVIDFAHTRATPTRKEAVLALFDAAIQFFLFLSAVALIVGGLYFFA